MKRRDLYKSPHAGYAVKVRSALDQRHPTTGHVISTIPSVWAIFGEPTGSVQIINPLTGESDVAETYRGGTFDLQTAAEENGWDEDVQLMVRDTLDMLCKKTPVSIQRVDFVIAPGGEAVADVRQRARRHRGGGGRARRDRLQARPRRQDARV
jgi:hypothetical protein